MCSNEDLVFLGHVEAGSEKVSRCTVGAIGDFTVSAGSERSLQRLESGFGEKFFECDAECV